MPAVTNARRPKRFDYRKLPVWVQWTLPFAVAIVFVLALIVWIHHETDNVPSQAGISASALKTENQQAETVIRQQQAPHHALLASGAAPAVALKHAITSWLNGQIKIGQMNGPLNSVSCVSAAGSTSARVAMKCNLVTANVTYPFYGVVIPASHSITYCQKIAYPAQYGMAQIPLSKSCLAS